MQIIVRVSLMLVLIFILLKSDIGDSPVDAAMQKYSNISQNQIFNPSPSRGLPHLAEESHAVQKYSDAQLTADSPVEVEIVEADVNFSHRHIPSRKRPRSLCKDHLARPELPQDGEPAVEEVDNGSVTTEILEGLPHPAKQGGEPVVEDVDNGSVRIEILPHHAKGSHETKT